MGTIKCDWCDRYFNHNCKDCRELNTHLRQLKSDLRKLVEDLRIGGKSLSPDATHAYMFCADKLEKLLGGE